jgi:acyl-CoA reductase-like NAD-dependent aldehyde dehydrogenase
MSFKLTYATMFEPPEALHASFEAALGRARERLGGRYLLHIGGAERASARYFTKTNPANTAETLGEFAAATPEDADAALKAAAQAFPAWRSTPLAERARLLRRVAQLIEERVYELAAVLTLEVGKNRMEALGEAQESADFFTLYTQDFEAQRGFDRALPDDPVSGYASHNRSVLKPHGPWVVIAPFNFPLALMAGPTAAALITGNTVVAKGASATPWADRLFTDCIRDAGLPPGVFNYLSGPGAVTGARLIANPLATGVTFTGSYEVGMGIVRALQSPPFPRPCIAEMGGKNACIVTAEADLARAALGIVRSAFGMGGQKCSALSRLYVHEAVADALTHELTQQIRAIRIGDPSQREHWLGPVTTAAAYEKYARYCNQLRAGGARILTGGEQLRTPGLEGGYYVRPTLAEAPLTHELWQEEMFLPILMMHRVEQRETAMHLANESPLGLTAGFYGGAGEVAWFNEHIQAGTTYANRPQGATTGAWPGYQAFGGWKGSGSTGKAIGSFYYLPQYLHEQSQTVVE